MHSILKSAILAASIFVPAVAQSQAITTAQSWILGVFPQNTIKYQNCEVLPGHKNTILTIGDHSLWIYKPKSLLDLQLHGEGTLSQFENGEYIRVDGAPGGHIVLDVECHGCDLNVCAMSITSKNPVTNDLNIKEWLIHHTHFLWNPIRLP